MTPWTTQRTIPLKRLVAKRGMVLALKQFRPRKGETDGDYQRLKELFDNAKVSYEVYNHPLAYTAQEIAQRQHFSGDQMAKVVILAKWTTSL